MKALILLLLAMVVSDAHASPVKPARLDLNCVSSKRGAPEFGIVSNSRGSMVVFEDQVFEDLQFEGKVEGITPYVGIVNQKGGFHIVLVGPDIDEAFSASERIKDGQARAYVSFFNPSGHFESVCTGSIEF